MWNELLMSVGQALVLLVGLTVIYRILFRPAGRPEWSRLIIERTRVWAYVTIFLASALWLVYTDNSLPGRAGILEVLEFLVYAPIGIALIESFLTILYDYILIHRQRAPVPAIFKDIGRGVLYLILIGVYCWKVLHIDITPLLTGSAIASILIGLALQETLGNIFSGLALHLSHPFSLGDWIKVGEYEGRVERIDWRATSIKTLTDDYVVIPNSSLAKQDLQNYSSPTMEHARLIAVGAHYRHAPNLVIDTMLAAARVSEGVLKVPEPKVWVMEYGDFSITYKIKFWINDFAKHNPIETNVMRSIWYFFKRAGIAIPFPIREVYHHQGVDGAPDPLGEGEMLRDIDFLNPLSPEDIADLAKRLRHEVYAEGHVMFRQGDPGDRFYVVKSGGVEVIVHNSAGDVAFTTALGPNSFFGEMSLLTGDPRSATIKVAHDSVLLSLGKEDLKDLLGRHPHLDEMICNQIADRQARDAGAITESETAAAARAKDGDGGKRRLQLLERVRKFFAY